MENFVFNVPIAAQHPYEQNLRDYDVYFMRDLDLIFQQLQPELPDTQFSLAENNSITHLQRVSSSPAVVIHQPWQADDETFFNQIVHHQPFTSAENVTYGNYFNSIDQFENPHYLNAIPNNEQWGNIAGVQAIYPSIEYTIPSYQNELLDLDCNNVEIQASSNVENQEVEITQLPIINCNEIELDIQASLSTHPSVQLENVVPNNHDTPESLKSDQPSANSSFRCAVCTRTFVTKRALTCHTARNAACRNSSSNRCEQCDQSFASRRALQAHIKEHKSRTVVATKVRKQQPQKKNFSCPLCSQSFTTRNARNQHKRSHRSIEDIAKISESTTIPTSGGQRRAFPCDLCSHIFAYRTLLHHHRRTEHAAPLRFPCQIGFCDQIFRNEGLLNRHVLLRHPKNDNDESIKPAADGGNGVLAAATVKSDAVVRCTHTGCALTFENVLLLRRHQTLHRLRTYRCVACGRQYHSRAVYETHVRLSHPKRVGMADGHDDVVLVADEDVDSGPMECVACSQLFENRRVLRLHRQFCAEDDGVAAEAEASAAAERRVQLTGNPIAMEEVYVKQEPMEQLNEYLMEE